MLKIENRLTPTLQGQLLIAMPGMSDSRFSGTVSLVCYHNEHGTMAVVLNRLLGTMNAEQVLEGLRSDIHWPQDSMRVHAGGPVMGERGFIIHGNRLKHTDSQAVTAGIRISGTTDVLLQLLVQGDVPWRLVLGCASWIPGQLEHEIRTGAWLTAPATPQLVFQSELPRMRDFALNSIGIAHPEMLVAMTGEA